MAVSKEINLFIDIVDVLIVPQEGTDQTAISQSKQFTTDFFRIRVA